MYAMEGREYSSWILERVAIGETVRLRFGDSTMGRHSSCNIRVLDATFVSRHHALIQVSKNDKNVAIQVVSSNGIYVNERRYENEIVQLKNNDLIGIGILPINVPESENIIKLPIYQLKYAPIRNIKLPNAIRSPRTPITKPELDINIHTNRSNEKETVNTDRYSQKPCGSTAINVDKLNNGGEIFEISDDEEGDTVEKPEINEVTLNIEQKGIETKIGCNENQQNLLPDLKKEREFIINTETPDDKECITPSQKCQTKRDKDVEFIINPSSKSINDISYAIDINSEKKQTPDELKISESLVKNKEDSNLKKERLRSVSADIQNIFGDIDSDDEIQKTLKDIDPLVYNEIHGSKNVKHLVGQEKNLKNGDLIVLTDDEDLDDVEVEDLGTIIPNKIETKGEELEAKKFSNAISDTIKKENKSTAMEGKNSPDIFDSSLDNSKEEGNTKGNQNKLQKATGNAEDIDLDEYIKHVSNSDDEDIEDLLFSQVIINDMKAELQDELNIQENLPLPNTNIDNQLLPAVANDGNGVIIKQEVFSSIPKELENSQWIISDDEDYDEELETKVNDWSNKIFSQSFNLLSQNMSQIYELVDPDQNPDNEEPDYFEEDNISLWEDDIDGIANIYNSIEHPNVDKKPTTLSDEMKNDANQALNELNNKSANENFINTTKIPDNDIRQENLESMTTEKIENKEVNPEIRKPAKEKSPDIQTCDVSNDLRIPIMSISSSHTGVQSSSADDNLDKKNQIPKDLIAPEPVKPLTRLIPPVIDAPSLPKHKGKLRGVSAKLSKKSTSNLKSTSVNKTINSVKEKIRQERYTKDMKSKWFEKPSTAKKRDKEHRKFIKECRKDKLKKIAESKKSPSKESIKRKLSTESNEHKAKVAKVKVTTHNRGAFLTNNEPAHLPPAAYSHKADQLNQFKIPKITKRSDEQKTPNSAENNKKSPATRSISMDCYETFSQQISKPDDLLFKQPNYDTKNHNKSNPMNKIHKPELLRRHSITETLPCTTQTNLEGKSTPPPPSSTICKEAIAARAIRTTNKITFASMEKNIVESEANKRKLSALSTSSLTLNNKDISSTKPSVKKKTVRFNDTPVIHYIERVTGACKKINYKDVMPLTTYKDRRHLIRTAYPIIDHTDIIISKILCWSNEWLIRRNAAAEAASDVIYPMPTHFTSFEHYKSIIIPLMKLEFVSTLEREFNMTKNVKIFKVSLEYATINQDRIMLITKFSHFQSKELMDSSLYDLVLLESDKKGPQIFAFVVANRKGAGNIATIVYEIIAKNFTVEYFKAINEFNVRPVMDRVRVHFGAFNSVYQLQSTPLFQKILNPLELLKCRPPPKKKVIYRGFDKLNDKQKQILLNTYVKIIDESTPNITLIQGPPGTGKTCVITNLVLQTLYGEDVRYLDKKILICAQSNAAVDVIAGKLYDISLRMRPEKRFRLLRYGMLNKIHPNVQPIALQKVVEYDQLKKLQAKNKNIQLENKENLKNQILQLEAQLAEMTARNIKGTVEEDTVIEKKRQLQIMRNILNESLRPEDERSLFSWYLCNANIVCATLSSCVNLSQYINFFDICIIDEATQCTEPWTLLPLKFGINSLVLVGDTQQLPATVLSKKANELGLGTSMFTRIQQCLDGIPCTSAKGSTAVITTPNNIIYSLQTQYRMHPEICRWPNQYFYRNELINDKSTIDLNKSPLIPFSILSLTYTQNNSGINGKITNNLEADFVAKLLKALDGFIPNKYNSYGVITPYAHHRTTLESSIRNLGLTNITVNTIDSYQGLEKDVIVISNARTNGIGFLSNAQRLNVALTRSKKCLILCGNFKNLETVPAWRCLLENARERKLYHEISSNCIEDIHANVIDKLKLKNQNH